MPKWASSESTSPYDLAGLLFLTRTLLQGIEIPQDPDTKEFSNYVSEMEKLKAQVRVLGCFAFQRKNAALSSSYLAIIHMAGQDF